MRTVRGLGVFSLVLGFAATARAGFVEAGVVVIHTFSGEAAGDGFGWAVGDLHDIDGDGVTDIIVPAPFNNAAASGAGRVYVYSGRTGALLHTFTGARAGGQLGYAIGDAGDVDGDGMHDIVAGAQGPTTHTGSVAVFSGADGHVIWEAFGEAVGDGFGAAVGGLGDLDGDGFSEVAVGAPGNDAGGVNSGRVYVLSGASGAVMRTYTGPAASARFGVGVASAGDINGDGKNELIVGADGVDLAYVYDGATGAAYFPGPLLSELGSTFGQFFVGAAGDVNNDGTPDLYVGDYGASKAYVFSGLDGSRIYRLTAGGGLGCGRFAGDVNRDGYDDLVVGAYNNSLGAPSAGKAFVYSGRDGTVLRTITSNTGGEQFGFDAVGIGDVNGDGGIDFLIGAASGDRVYVIAGDPRPTCAGDVDGDFDVDLSDLGALLAEYGCTSNCQTDLNGDTVVDLSDLGIVLASFGQPCP